MSSSERPFGLDVEDLVAPGGLDWANFLVGLSEKGFDFFGFETEGGIIFGTFNVFCFFGGGGDVVD